MVLVGLAVAFDALWHWELALGIFPGAARWRCGTLRCGAGLGLRHCARDRRWTEGRTAWTLERCPPGVCLGSTAVRRLHPWPPWCRLWGCVCADGLPILAACQGWRGIWGALGRAVGTLALCLGQWRLDGVGRSQWSSVWALRGKGRGLGVCFDARRLDFRPATTCLGVGLDGALSYRQCLAGLGDGVVAWCARPWACGCGWGAGPLVLRTSTLALVCAPAGCCTPVWSGGGHASMLNVGLGCALRVIAGCLRPAPVGRLPVLAGVPPARLHGQAAGLALACRAVDPGRLLHCTIDRGWGGNAAWTGILVPFCHGRGALLLAALPSGAGTYWVAVVG